MMNVTQCEGKLFSKLVIFLADRRPLRMTEGKNRIKMIVQSQQNEESKVTYYLISFYVSFHRQLVIFLFCAGSSTSFPGPFLQCFAFGISCSFLQVP